MMYGIKFSVMACAIDERRKEHEIIKEKMFQLDRKMADMTLNREVGLYAYNLDKYKYLLQLLNSLPVEKQGKIKKELTDLETYFIISRRNYNIIRYKALCREYDVLQSQLGDYYKAINIDLRNELKDITSPHIYVYQVENKSPLLKHIIFPTETLPVSANIKYNGYQVIYPFYEIYSNREFRHFYNKTSFKYLEELSKDYSFKLENKRLGNVKIKKMY